MILTHCLFREELTDIIDELNTQISCDFVHRYVEIPSIPYVRMQVLFLFLHDSGVAYDQIKQYLIPTSLIQVALDCHEEVTLLPQVSEQGIRRRQLTVLAGDLFSSKYYYLLSNLGDIPLIKTLAKSIYDINVAKTQLYTQHHLPLEEAMQLRTKIDTALFTSFIPRFSDELVAVWRRLMEQLSLIERLVQELSRYQSSQELSGHMKKLAGEISVREAANRVRLMIEQAIGNIQEDVYFLRKDEVKQGIRDLIKSTVKQTENQVSIP
ncbi:heptaprenyl diphosphate synthase component 1 [Ammoniphilus sp. YIM 78166]|uniref:heptaprenyl diphosphate synthase component 1 n=1 Tax=Ammoniphilus sp. YIM 78166 TaxID=1644106 RepID=UPI00106FDA22|nr:heptaprenyl diphosphate synthase component 1 [Ammoniphilus sp. YIM 78166]